MLGSVVLLAVQLSVLTASPAEDHTHHVSIRVTNDGDAPYYLRDAGLELVDANGRRFPAQGAIERIEAGATRQVGVLFLVTENLEGALILESTALGWTSDALPHDTKSRQRTCPDRSPAQEGDYPFAGFGGLLEFLLKAK